MYRTEYTEESSAMERASVAGEGVTNFALEVRRLCFGGDVGAGV